MNGFRSQSINGRIFSSDAGQWLNVTRLLPPQQRQFPLQAHMGMPQPFAAPLGFVPGQQNSAALPVQRQQFLQQQHFLLLPQQPQQLPQAAAAPTTPAPAPSNEVIDLVSENAQQQGTAPSGATVEPNLQRPTITNITAPVKRRRGRPTNESKGLPTKRPVRKPTRNGSACAAASASTSATKPTAKKPRAKKSLHPSCSLPSPPLTTPSPLQAAEAALTSIFSSASTAAPEATSGDNAAASRVNDEAVDAGVERQLGVLAEADFANPLAQASGEYEIVGEDEARWAEWLKMCEGRGVMTTGFGFFGEALECS
ncbi:hypothetical protein yc1106_05478 [Curvularia clavata]|uniref:Uncharacterized protein n=1 Tax=Curvularia clavata TaxID=95742 RepID=A0A9Q9DTW5_CURCL|nr:hypothetical protein yc1106_05478 [Curvularia clavata]